MVTDGTVSVNDYEWHKRKACSCSTARKVTGPSPILLNISHPSVDNVMCAEKLIDSVSCMPRRVVPYNIGKVASSAMSRHSCRLSLSGRAEISRRFWDGGCNFLKKFFGGRTQQRVPPLVMFTVWKIFLADGRDQRVPPLVLLGCWKKKFWRTADRCNLHSLLFRVPAATFMYRTDRSPW